MHVKSIIKNPKTDSHVVTSANSNSEIPASGGAVTVVSDTMEDNVGKEQKLMKRLMISQLLSLTQEP